VTAQIELSNTGTEMNEAPDADPNQAPRQRAPNTGPVESAVVHPARHDLRYPAVSDVLRMTNNEE
jgi:hypothetical protein